jgi:PAS domain S-box-containing protein
MIAAVIRFPRLYQGQALMLVLGSLIPLFSNFLFLINVNPLAPLDISPIALTLSGLFFTVGMLRFGLFNIVPVAHDLVVKNVNSGVIVVDLKGRILEINPAAAHVLNRSRDELVGQDALTALPEYAVQIHQFQDTWETKTELALGQRIYELEITPLANRHGKLAGRIILLYDITERKQALLERDILIKELGAYAHTVAHDLKNPLSLIVGYSNLMLRKEKEALTDSAIASLQTIAKTGNKMAEIVDALLLLASVRSMEKVEMKPLDTAVLIHNAWNRLTGSGEVAAELIMPEGWPTAVGYAPWVEQVWINYLSNAIKYGGAPPRVEVGVDMPPVSSNGIRPYLRFWVRDNGKGLSSDEAEQLFQQFARLDQHTAVQGHGLGLSIVQRIVERLGGTVGVESEPGVGSTFYFTLPMADTAVMPDPKPAISQPEPIA